MAGALLRFGAIVLAAGLSRRMGGPNKLLQPYRGQPLLAHALESAAKAGLASRVVVTGRDPAEIEALAALYGFRCVHNARFSEGLGASIAAGASAADASLAGVFIALGDMPEVLADDYRLLASRFAHGAIAAPVYKARAAIRCCSAPRISTSFRRCGGKKARARSSSVARRAS